MRVIDPSHEEWPDALNELGPHRPPTRLYLQGEALVPPSKAVAIVGTRRPTGAGVQAARTIARRLAESDHTVVSGLAVGIDAVAHAT
ncbi:MAG: DNA-processing protein DprA, partial [Actinomycetota bacterium]